MQFSQLSTVQFQNKMSPHVLDIYSGVFPGCRVECLNSNNGGAHVLDQLFGIDALIHIGDQWISIQEKFRENSALKYMDFTQEYKNAVGLDNESDGEFFHLGAQLYFYGWANSDYSGFEKWFIMDVFAYKMIVDSYGGIEEIGSLRQNKTHGSASFYAIDIKKIMPAFVADYRMGVLKAMS